MATAREQLIGQLVPLFLSGSAPQEELIGQILDGFRIQAKPETPLEASQTARALLLGKLMLLGTKGAKDNKLLQDTVDGFRMQLKQQGLNPSPANHEKSSVKLAATRTKPTPMSRGTQNTAKKEKAIRVEPVGGGPLKRNKARGQCPKCHSMGVVLAQAYSGDEYYACIYCGFQAFKKEVNGELGLPMAQELLGRTFDDKSSEDA